MSMKFSCFITGTDTGVGKTIITAAMLNALGQLKLKAVGMKPVAAGTLLRDGVQWNEDVAMLAEQSTLTLDPKLTTSYLLNEPCAPHVAAQLQDVTISPTVLTTAYQQVAAQAEAVATLVRWTTSAPAPGIAVPRAWPGLRDGRFALGLVDAAAKAPLPGVLAHQYFGHADGPMLVLYAWLRVEAGLAPDIAFEEAVKRSTGVRRADVRDLLPTHAVA